MVSVVFLGTVYQCYVLCFCHTLYTFLNTCICFLAAVLLQFSPNAAAAVIFFLFEDIMSVLLTLDLLGKITWFSLIIKVVSCTVACVSVTMRSILDNMINLLNRILY